MQQSPPLFPIRAADRPTLHLLFWLEGNSPMQGLQEYSLNPKVHHRRMVWNKIAKRFRGIRKHATGVVLAGPEPVDRECLESAGFKKSNFVFVDTHKPNVMSARSEGLTGFHGDVFEYLLASKTPVDILHLDFCCGFKHSIANSLMRLMFCGIIDDSTVIYVNMQRGRDEGTCGIFKNVSYTRDAGLSKTHVDKMVKKRSIKLAYSVSRSCAISLLFSDSGLSNYIEYSEQCCNNKCCKECSMYGYCNILNNFVNDQAMKRLEEKLSIQQGHIYEAMDHSCFEYKSNMVYMDSIIMTWPLTLIAKDDAKKVIMKEIDSNKEFMRKVAACKAVQTSRQN